MSKQPFGLRGFDLALDLKRTFEKFEQIIRGFENISQKHIAFTRSADNFQQVQRRLAQSLAQIAQAPVHLSGLFRIKDSVDRTLWSVSRALSNSKEKFEGTMLSLGWPAPISFTLNDIIEIEEAIETEGEDALRRRVDQFMLDRHSAEILTKVVEQWGKKKWLQKRMPILRDIIEAHNSGKYRLSVPSLLPQIEGVIAQGFAHHGQMNGKRLSQYVSDLLASGHASPYGSPMKEFMLQWILVSFQHGVPLTSNLSRHAILHGADTDYGTATNSLKLILLFDYLQDAFRLIATKAGRHYHYVGCPMIVRSTSKRVVFKSLTEAHGTKRTPCKYCFKPERRSA